MHSENTERVLLLTLGDEGVGNVERELKSSSLGQRALIVWV